VIVLYYSESNISRDILEKTLEDIKEYANRFRRFDQKRTYDAILPIDKRWLQFGLCGDTHYVNNFCDEDAISRYYSNLWNDGIRNVFHAGDMWDGCTGYNEVYRGQIHDVPFLGYDRSLEYVKEKYPKREGMATRFISGNHEGRILEKEGVNFGSDLASVRDDLIYLQPYYARLKLSDNPPLLLDLVHLGGGIPYTVGYSIQKYIRRIPPLSRANIFGFGHTHHHEHVSAEGDDESFLVGGFQESNEFTVRKGMGSTIGGWKVRIKLSDNSPNPIERCEATFIRC